MKHRPGNPGLKGRLLEKSIEADILSLETINRLSVKYRAECFAYLICNAWELLLKAKLIDDTKDRTSIFYPGQGKNPARSLTARDCAKQVLTNDRDPIRRNIERMADLRDESTHLVICQVPKGILGLFQACVLNYHECLGKWFALSLSDRVPVGMMTIVYDLQPQDCKLSNAVLRRRLGREALRYLSAFQAEIQNEYESLNRAREFAEDIAYSLALVEKPGDGDVALHKGTSGALTGVVEVAKDPGKSYPFRQKELIQALNAALQGAATVNSYDIQCVIAAYDVKRRPDFYCKGIVQGSPGQYSNAFLKWLVEKYQEDNTLFQRAREKVKSAKISHGLGNCVKSAQGRTA